MTKVMKRFQLLKVDDDLGLVFGFAVVCSEDGEPYVDLQGELVTPQAMMKAAVDFARGARRGREMHETDDGDVVFLFPLTAEVAKALDIETRRTGLLTALAPSNPETLAKIKAGEYTGLSIGGEYVTVETVEMEEAS
jgi:hypothetical protein